MHVKRTSRASERPHTGQRGAAKPSQSSGDQLSRQSQWSRKKRRTGFGEGQLPSQPVRTLHNPSISAWQTAWQGRSRGRSRGTETSARRLALACRRTPIGHAVYPIAGRIVGRVSVSVAVRTIPPATRMFQDLTLRISLRRHQRTTQVRLEVGKQFTTKGTPLLHLGRRHVRHVRRCPLIREVSDSSADLLPRTPGNKFQTSKTRHPDCSNTAQLDEERRGFGTSLGVSAAILPSLWSSCPIASVCWWSAEINDEIKRRFTN